MVVARMRRRAKSSWPGGAASIAGLRRAGLAAGLSAAFGADFARAFTVALVLFLAAVLATARAGLATDWIAGRLAVFFVVFFFAMVLPPQTAGLQRERRPADRSWKLTRA